MLIRNFPIRYTKWQFYGYTGIPWYAMVYHGIPWYTVCKPTNRQTISYSAPAKGTWWKMAALRTWAMRSCHQVGWGTPREARWEMGWFHMVTFKNEENIAEITKNNRNCRFVDDPRRFISRQLFCLQFGECLGLCVCGCLKLFLKHALIYRNYSLNKSKVDFFQYPLNCKLVEKNN